MKKILTILAVALLSTATVFAVTISGSTTAGYAFNFDGDVQRQYFFGDDDEGSNLNTLKINVKDENGIWSLSLRNDLVIDSSGAMGGNLNIDFGKMFGLEEFTLNGGVVANDRYTTLRAYSNQSGNNYDRIRTAKNSYVSWLGLGYGGYVTAQVAVDPGVIAPDSLNRSDVLASVLVTPVDGVEVSVDWALKGSNYDHDANGLVGAAVDANIGKIADLDFTVGVSAAWQWDYDAEKHTIAATVYGGVDAAELAVEYAYTADKLHYLYVGADLNVVENMLLDVYFGANNLELFGDTFFVGGDIGYTLAGLTFKLGCEYSASSDSYNYDNAGFTIVPSVSFSW